MQHTAFFGDGEHTFALTPPMIQELEKKTSAGFGVLLFRLVAKQFSMSDIVETIRCALIGGGKPPAEAADLVKTYVAERPFIETFPLALTILETRFFGADAAQDTENG